MAKARVSRPEMTGKSESPGRPPPPSAKSTTGSRSREHGVVVGQDRTARPLVIEHVPVDPPDSGDEAVGGRVRHQILCGSPSRLGRHGEAAVLLEAAFVAQVVHEPSGRSLSRAVAAVRRGLTRLVAEQPAPLEQLGQIGADLLEVDGGWHRS
jgi:hypothetical protein